MGLILTLRSGENEWQYPLDSADIAALETASQFDPVLRDAYKLVFGPSQNGEQRRVLVQSANQALESIHTIASKGINVSTYWIIASPMPGKIPPGSCSGMTGILINGEQYWLFGGIEECKLQKVGVSADGLKLEAKETQDIRHLKRLLTDNFGEVRIQRRSKPSRILKIIHELQDQIKNLKSNSEVVFAVG